MSNMKKSSVGRKWQEARQGNVESQRGEIDIIIFVV